ncbi:voltage-dependent anion-selective channel protein 3 isoform X3 [Poecile atricapillus]|uniref:voltage-dependent anion-selective channel protein 3 isoform X3 n=1 Tax=Poecile atricapillus TaxID=48891 RepID=UPI002739A921|nr:voltage-dependent anion-selective channel protein 3 isoform X3 [Poecile atricapillus]
MIHACKAICNLCPTIHNKNTEKTARGKTRSIWSSLQPVLPTQTQARLQAVWRPNIRSKTKDLHSPRSGTQITHWEQKFLLRIRKKSGKLKTSYKREYIHLGCSVDIDLSGPTIYGWAVLGFDGWLAGYQTAFDTAKYKLSQNNFALGYKAGDFQLHTYVNDGTEFGGSIYQKINNKVETSVNLAWTAGSNNTRFGFAGKYQMDEKTSVVAKVNNASLIGIGYTHALRPGVKLTLSGLIDGKNFSAGGHKIGLGFELEA